MGVVLTTGLVVCAIMAGFELYVVRSLRPEKFKPEMYNPVSRFIMQFVYRIGPWIEKSALHSLAFSLSISLALGALYPIAGIAAMIGGVGSTVVMQPYYQAIRLGRKAKVSYRETYKPKVKRTFAATSKVATAPIRKYAEFRGTPSEAWRK